jgi:hypothetical protein
VKSGSKKNKKGNKGKKGVGSREWGVGSGDKEIAIHSPFPTPSIPFSLPLFAIFKTHIAVIMSRA